MSEPVQTRCQILSDLKAKVDSLTEDDLTTIEDQVALLTTGLQTEFDARTHPQIGLDSSLTEDDLTTIEDQVALLTTSLQTEFDARTHPQIGLEFRLKTPGWSVSIVGA
jgi:ABC-type phosphate transport system auxiliary subunit